MTDETHSLRRIPGLYRRWELQQVLMPGEVYHLEEASRTSTGEPLLAVFRHVGGNLAMPGKPS